MTSLEDALFSSENHNDKLFYSRDKISETIEESVNSEISERSKSANKHNINESELLENICTSEKSNELININNENPKKLTKGSSYDGITDP